MKTQLEIEASLKEQKEAPKASEFENGWTVGYVRALEFVLELPNDFEIVQRFATNAQDQSHNSKEAQK